jgi:hypothetical protein
MTSSASLQLFPLLKEKSYEDVENDAVDGSDCIRSSGNGKGGAGGMLPVG